MISIERLKELVTYNLEDGLFRWKISRVGCRAGDVAGSVCKSGYVQICFDRKIYRAHRVAIFYMTGEWPPHYVDHANGNATDNTYTNLRLATQFQNMANSKPHKRKENPLKGAYRDKTKWTSRITHHGKHIRLGNFNTPEEAHAAYVAASRLLNGEFARSE